MPSKAYQALPTISITLNKQDLVDWQKWKTTIADDHTEIVFGQSRIALAKFKYPTQFFTESADGFSTGYSITKTDQFSISLNNDALTISTPSCGQITLFYYETPTYLYAADTFENLLQLIPASQLPNLDFLGIADFLLYRFNLATRTVLEGVKHLRENRTLSVTPSGPHIEITQPVRSLLHLYDTLAMKSNPLEALGKLLNDQVETVLSMADSDTMVGSTLSGGVDSALVSYVAAQKTPLTYFTLVQPPEEVPLQQARLDKLSSLLPGNREQLYIGGVPLFDLTDPLKMIDPYTEMYDHLFEELAIRAEAQDVDIILGGMGADDFFTLTHAHQKHQNSEHENVDFFTSLGKNMLAQIGTWQVEKPSSVVLSAGCEAYYYFGHPWRKYGIWPVAPFFSNELVSLSLQIPEKLKQKKELLKQFVSKVMGAPDIVEGAKDSFRPYFEKEFRSFLRTDGHALLSASALFKFDVINFEHLEQIMTSFMSGKTILKSQKLMIYSIVRLELFIRAYQTLIKKGTHD